MKKRKEGMAAGTRGWKRVLYSQKIAPFVFIMPFVLTFLIFWMIPLIKAGIMSFQEVLPGQTTFVGLKNYTKLMGDANFRIAVINSLKYTVGTLLLLIPVPMLLAYMINSRLMPGKEVFKSVFFVPILTSIVVAGTIFRLMFGEMDSAFMNSVIQFFGMEPIKWLKNGATAYIALLLLASWRWMGVNMLYFLSGLNSIPTELYESASIDGASAWKKFIYVTLPMLKPTITYVLTISIYGGLAMFTESYMLWAGKDSPQNIGLTIVGYLYKRGIRQNEMGYAAAVGVILLAITMVINLVQLTISGMFKKEE
ncbi:MAG: sugar ABC transporter permease [Lachnospiraceae bacterium]|nr:sugar ABC transporter permease [Lachnospiraceae bacterium]